MSLASKLYSSWFSALVSQIWFVKVQFIPEICSHSHSIAFDAIQLSDTDVSFPTRSMILNAKLGFCVLDSLPGRGPNEREKRERRAQSTRG